MRNCDGRVAAEWTIFFKPVNNLCTPYDNGGRRAALWTVWISGGTYAQRGGFLSHGEAALCSSSPA